MAPTLEEKVQGHYTTTSLLDRIKAGLVTLGHDADAPAPEHLKGVDEFHTGGLKATEHLLEQLDLSTDLRVLDIGCGIGGSVRHLALATGGSVTGVDLTPDFVETATKLSEMVGLGDRTTYLQGSALDLPVEDHAYDLVTMFHVGMNINDKSALMAEVARVLAPGGRFAVFDVMAGEVSGPQLFPLPWASDAEFSCVERPKVYKDAAAAAGLELVAETDRTDFAKRYFEEVGAAMAKAGGPPPIGIHLLMGNEASIRLKNYVDELEIGRVAPVEMIFRAPDPAP